MTDQTDAEKFLACPFCGSNRIWRIPTIEQFGNPVSCRECCASGPDPLHDLCWNDRAAISAVTHDDDSKVRRLVLAAREGAFGDTLDRSKMKELDAASEAFAEDYPWDDEPAALTPQPITVEQAAQVEYPWGDLSVAFYDAIQANLFVNDCGEIEGIGTARDVALQSLTTPEGENQ